MLTSIIIASILVSLSALTGGLLLFWKKLFTNQMVPYLVSFAAGVILTTAFFDLLPEALEHAEEQGGHFNVFMPIFLGIVISFFLERFVLWFHHHDEHHGEEPASVLILLGDGFHNFLDGVVIAGAFLTDPAVGVATTIAIAVHEIPHEISDFAVLVHSGMSKAKAVTYNFAFSITALLGAIGGYFFLQKIEGSLPFLLAFSGGMFIYIACADLIPDLHKDFKKQRKLAQIVPFIIGILLMYFSLAFLNHGH